MTVVVLGLVSALLYGVSDFFGALASRRRPAPLVAFAALSIAAVVVLPALVAGGAVWSVPAVVLGGLAGVAAGVGVLLLYAALAAGPVGFVSPVVALLTAVLPSLLAFATGERPTAGSLGALAAVVTGGVLIGFEPDEGLRPRPRTVALTVVTGFVYAGYLIAMDATPPESGAVPLVVDGVVAAVVSGGILLALRRRRAPSPAPATAPAGRGGRAATAAAGITQGVATVLLVAALHLPGLAVVSALSALYPVTTVLLAVAVLRERIRPHQVLGLLVAVGGVAALAVLRG